MQLKNNTIIIVTNNTAREINICEFDSLSILYNKTIGKVNVVETKTEHTSLSLTRPAALFAPSQPSNVAKPIPDASTLYDRLVANGWTDEQINSSEEFRHVLPAHKKNLLIAAGLRNSTHKGEEEARKSFNRTDFAKGPNVITKRPVRHTVNYIIAYRKGGNLKRLAGTAGVKPGTLVSWASTVNRIILGKPVAISGKSKLYEVAAYIRANRMTEFSTYKR